jgi:hypothetical protein
MFTDVSHFKTELLDPLEKRLDARLVTFSISGSIAQQQEKGPERQQQSTFDRELARSKVYQRTML